MADHGLATEGLPDAPGTTFKKRNAKKLFDDLQYLYAAGWLLFVAVADHYRQGAHPGGPHDWCGVRQRGAACGAPPAVVRGGDRTAFVS